ncbi:MAG: DegT/DnrJ/EryC1/StrS family aminotransferase [Verrucomicrobiota bacterium]|nr:DegT/DnrJ/EryC1/StrS family aminotransferase [Verrucomicrobiota bacterium]
MHLLISRDVLVQHLLALNEEESAFRRVCDAASGRGDTLWLHMASIRNALEEAKKQLSERSNFSQPAATNDELRRRMSDAVRKCGILPSLADELDALWSSEPDIAQARIALSRLPGKPKRITFAPSVDPADLTPESYLAMKAASAPMPFIDLERQQKAIRAGLERSIHRVLHHGQYILGPEIETLEARLADYVGVKHAITVASGTDALLIALMALEIGPGDEVITVPYTWISTAEVIALLRARPVFVDVEWDTMNMDAERMRAAITSRTRAIIPVGIYGQCADMTRITSIASEWGIPVIEDAAQCFGATHHGRRSCGLSLIGCTSFFPSKPLGCYGDGGAIFTNDDGLAEKMRQIRVHGQKVKHQHPVVGLNGRMDTLQAAIVLEKLSVFDKECVLRREVARRYDEMLKDASGIVTPIIRPENTSVYAQYTIRLDNPDLISTRLQSQGIPTVSYYKTPLHLQGAFSNLGYRPGDFPVAERIASTCLSLPMSPYLTAEEQRRVVSSLLAARSEIS